MARYMAEIGEGRLAKTVNMASLKYKGLWHDRLADRPGS